MAFRVLFDACVLVPYDLCNVFLTLAEANFYQPLWSDEILDETRRTLVNRLGSPEAKARKRIEAMTVAFPGASVTEYQGLLRAMTCHRKDRRVLAAAVRGEAQIIVTANLK